MIDLTKFKMFIKVEREVMEFGSQLSRDHAVNGVFNAICVQGGGQGDWRRAFAAASAAGLGLSMTRPGAVC